MRGDLRTRRLMRELLLSRRPLSSRATKLLRLRRLSRLHRLTRRRLRNRLTFRSTAILRLLHLRRRSRQITSRLSLRLPPSNLSTTLPRQLRRRQRPFSRLVPSLNNRITTRRHMPRPRNKLYQFTRRTSLSLLPLRSPSTIRHLLPHHSRLNRRQHLSLPRNKTTTCRRLRLPLDNSRHLPSRLHRRGRRLSLSPNLSSR